MSSRIGSDDVCLVFVYGPPTTPPDSVIVLVEVAMHAPVIGEVPPAVNIFAVER